MKHKIEITSVPANESVSVDIRTKRAHDGIWYINLGEAEREGIMGSIQALTPGLVRVSVDNITPSPAGPFTISLYHERRHQ